MSRSAVATTAAIPAVPSPVPRSAGSTHTPWTWQTDRLTAPISALNSTRPFSIRANARPAAISSATLARYSAPPSPPSGETPTSSVYMATQAGSTVSNSAVRTRRTAEFDTVLPACVAMYTEEVGVSPLGGDGGALYRARVAELIAAGRAFARIENGRVLFKAEIGAVSRSVCQVQGVWVDPALRGTGLGTAGTAAVVATALRDIAPIVSLYVNDYNEAARAAYRRVGLRQVGTFMSVLF